MGNWGKLHYRRTVLFYIHWESALFNLDLLDLTDCEKIPMQKIFCLIGPICSEQPFRNKTRPNPIGTTKPTAQTYSAK